MATKPKSTITPRGVAMYPWLTKPDTKFDAGGIYKMSLQLNSEDGSTQELADKIRDLYLEEYGDKKLARANFPFKEDGEGNTVFSFKSRKKPKIYNSKGQIIANPDSLKIGGGSEVKVSFTMQAYDKGSNCGVVLYLNAVQIIQLAEYKSGASSFGDEGDGFTGSGNAPEPVELDDEEDKDF
jgi:hypothetical protein